LGDLRPNLGEDLGVESMFPNVSFLGGFGVIGASLDEMSLQEMSSKEMSSFRSLKGFIKLRLSAFGYGDELSIT
jgi:hypothetical protein